MDRHEPKMHMNSNTDTEIGAARRFFNRTGNVLKGKNKLAFAAGAMTVATLTGCSVSANAEPSAPAAPTTSIGETPVASETPSYSETPIETETPTNEIIVNAPAITPENQAQRLAELQFSSEMTPQEMGEHYTDVMSEWGMAGATEEAWYENFMAMTNREEFATSIAASNRETYAVALFGEDYQENAALVRSVGILENANKNNILFYLATFGNDEFPNDNTNNLETWHLTLENTGVEVEEQTDTTLSLVVQQHTHVNADKTDYNDSPYDVDGGLTSTDIVIDLSKDTPVITSFYITDL